MIIIIKEKFFNITIVLFILIYPQHDDDEKNEYQKHCKKYIAIIFSAYIPVS